MSDSTLILAGSFSLPTQRCFFPKVCPLMRNDLFSAYAEVFLRFSVLNAQDIAFLCLRRGVSSYPLLRRLVEAFSLPTQRCFTEMGEKIWTTKLFSAYAEVFL